MRPLRSTIVGAAVLFFGDAFLLDQGLFSILVVFICVVGFVLLGLQSLIRRLRNKPDDWRVTAAKLGIVLIAALLVIAYVNVSNSMAERRALRIAAACDRYRTKYQHYPHNLSELVPEFLPSVPRAKYVMNPLWGEFMYLDNGPVILYYSMPPFGRSIYHLNSKTWSYLD